MIVSEFPYRGGVTSVDGRNLFIMSTSEVGYISDNGDGTVTKANKHGETTSDYIPVFEGEQLTIQVWATDTINDDISHFMISCGWYESNINTSYSGRKRYMGGQAGFNHAVVTIDPIPSDVNYVRIDCRLYSDGKVKVERGTIPTDWTLAPEDAIEVIKKFDERITALEKKNN